MPTGRPSIYSEELSADICRRMAEGESLNAICKDDSMPAKSTVMLWAASNREGFSDQYAKALEARAHHWAEELLDICDNAENNEVNKARLQVDTRKWLLSKLLPKYSDKPESNAGDDLAGALTKLVERLPE